MFIEYFNIARHMTLVGITTMGLSISYARQTHFLHFYPCTAQVVINRRIIFQSTTSLGYTVDRKSNTKHPKYPT